VLSERPDLKLLVPVVPAQMPALRERARASGLGERLQLVAGQSHTVLAACDLALVASGTATLEAALFKRPMVIAYRMHPLSWWLMRGKRLQPWVGLPNILCRDFVVPEFLQDAATPRALADALLDWLRHPQKIPPLQRRFEALHAELQRDTIQLATDAIEKVLTPAGAR
jgi:lipid-A-disaccharide synthase